MQWIWLETSCNITLYCLSSAQSSHFQSCSDCELLLARVKSPSWKCVHIWGWSCKGRPKHDDPEMALCALRCVGLASNHFGALWRVKILHTVLVHTFFKFGTQTEYPRSFPWLRTFSAWFWAPFQASFFHCTRILTKIVRFFSVPVSERQYYHFFLFLLWLTRTWYHLVTKEH